MNRLFYTLQVCLLASLCVVQPCLSVLDLPDGEWSVKFNDAGNDKITVTLTSEGDTWLAAGVPNDQEEESSAMINGVAVVYRPGDTPEIGMYKLKGFSSSSFELLASLDDSTAASDAGITDISASFIDGKTVLRFTCAKLDTINIVKDQTADGPIGDLILAYGPGKEFGPAAHAGKVHLKQILLTSDGNGSDELVITTKFDPLLSAHIALMVISWGVLIPFGVASAVVRRAGLGLQGGLWFKIHQGVNSTGVLLGSIGCILAIALVGKNGAPHFSDTHQRLGLVMLILGVLQAVGGAMRPHVEEVKTEKRKYWEYFHRGTGSLALIMGMLNVSLGAKLVLDSRGAETLIGTSSMSINTLSTLIYIIVAVFAAGFLCVCGWVGLNRKVGPTSIATEDEDSDVKDDLESTRNRICEDLGSA